MRKARPAKLLAGHVGKPVVVCLKEKVARGSKENLVLAGRLIAADVVLRPQWRDMIGNIAIENAQRPWIIVRGNYILWARIA